MFAWYRSLFALRREHPALSRGGLRWLYVADDVVVLERALPDERVVVQVARADHAGWTTPWRLENLLDGIVVEAGDVLSNAAGAGFWRVV